MLLKILLPSTSFLFDSFKVCCLLNKKQKREKSLKRMDKLIQEYIHDPYFTKEKYHDPSVCERCDVVFHDGIFNQIKNVEEEEMKYRPLERIISIEEQNDEIIIKTTYEHIARRIGEAIHRAHKGDLKLNYPKGKKYVRVYWQREE